MVVGARRGERLRGGARLLGPHSDSRSVSILLVEDDPGHAELVRRAMESIPNRPKVTLSRTLDEARQALRNITPDIAFVDLLLPDGSGLEMLPDDEQAPAYPVVIMTSHGDEEMAVKAMRSGALDYIVKSAQSLSELPHVADRSLREWEHIQERQRAERALHFALERYQVLYDNTPAMLFTVDVDHRLISVNRFGATQLGYQAEELVGKPASVLHPPEERASVAAHLDQCLADTEDLHQWEARKIRKDRSVLWVRESGRLVEGSQREPAVLLVCEDITEAHNLSERLSYQASHDALTGLLNRGAFDVRLRRVLKTAREQREEHALCYLDLDRFKIINDTCGHAAGDELLRQVGRLLADKIRKRDTLARLGGDEFGLLMEHCSTEQARRVAEALRATIEELEFFWDGKKFKIGVSIGLVPIPKMNLDVGEVMSAADAACYVAKDRGRNRIHVHHPGD